MLCRQCQQLRQKYLKHTWVGRGREATAMSAPAGAATCAACLLWRRRRGFLVVSLELEDTVFGNLLTPNTEAGPTVANPLNVRLDQTRWLLLCTETVPAPPPLLLPGLLVRPPAPPPPTEEL